MGNTASPAKHHCLPPPGAEMLQALLGGKTSQLSLSLTILNLLLPLAGQYENLGKYQFCKGSVSIMLLHFKVKADFLFLENSRLLLTLIGS